MSSLPPKGETEKALPGMVATMLRMVPVALVTGTLFFLSHQEGDSLPLPLLPGLDKIIHAGVYAVLAASVLYALPEDFRRRSPATAAALAALYCLLFGVSDEYHQSFISGRFASTGDLLADMAGSLALVTAWFLYRSRSGKARRSPER